MSKKTATAPKARPLTAAQRKKIAPVAVAARKSGAGEGEAIAAVAKALGKRPSLSLYTGTRTLYIGCYVAGRLGIPDDDGQALLSYPAVNAKRVGDNERRRTAEEEAAYTAGRQAFSRTCKAAGVTVPETRGQKGAATRKARAAEKAQKEAADAKAKETRAASPKLADREAVFAYIQTQAAAMLATVNKNAKVMPPAVSSLISDFADAVKKLDA